ncbi:MAG TPA: hypothetical protein VGM05_13340 [Planctomycetaceae bacterium]|jgi:hypothetical protein
MEGVPTELELVGDSHHIETSYVLGFFLGKTADEAYDMYRSDDFVPGGLEAFSYLSVRGLEYYLPPAIRYIESIDSSGNNEFVSGLLSALSDQMFHEPIRKCWSPRIPPNPLPPHIVDSIRRLAEYVRLNLKKFEMKESEIATSLLEINAAPPQ